MIWDRRSPDREAKEQSPWGWLFYRRVKTGKAFDRPMNRVVHAHLRGLMPDDPQPDASVFLGGGARPNTRFQAHCGLAGIKPRFDVETGREEPWDLKDLRKTCASYHDDTCPSRRWRSSATRSAGSRIATTPTGPRWPTGRS